MRTFFSTILCVLGLVTSSRSRGTQPIDPNALAAVYTLAEAGFVFALNVVENGDVYYHMNAPASHSWMGVGFGGSMTNTRMLISYISADGANLTNSCRMAYGHSEPVWEEDCVIEGVYTDFYAPYANTLSPGGLMVAHSVCRNCSTWAGGAIDVTSTAQQFIFALGPNTTIRSDNPAENLRFHQFHATFNMDMTVATNVSGDHGRVPAPQDPALQKPYSFSAFGSFFSSNDYNISEDVNWGPTVHAVVMCLAFLFVFPVGALLLRLTKKAFIHAVAQIVGVVLVVVGVGVGSYVSKMYIKSKDYDNPHQIIGFIICALLLVQVGFGLTRHAGSVRGAGVGPSLMGNIHRFMGMGTMILGLVNAGIGFNFADNQRDNISYGVIAAIVSFLFFGIIAYIAVHNRKRTYRPEKEGFDSSEQYLDDPNEYEMHEQPFAKATYVHTPQSLHFDPPPKKASKKY